MPATLLQNRFRPDTPRRAQRQFRRSQQPRIAGPTANVVRSCKTARKPRHRCCRPPPRLAVPMRDVTAAKSAGSLATPSHARSRGRNICARVCPTATGLLEVRVEVPPLLPLHHQHHCVIDVALQISVLLHPCSCCCGCCSGGVRSGRAAGLERSINAVAARAHRWVMSGCRPTPYLNLACASTDGRSLVARPGHA